MTLITSLSMTISEARSTKKPFSSTIMHRWEVNTTDSGGTLIFSDSPEYVKEDGILYSDVVEGDARVLFYHLNDSKTNKKIAVVIENVVDKPNIVKITRGGTAEPSNKFLAVGKAVQAAYMRSDFQETLYMSSGDKQVLQRSMDNVIIKPGQLIYGVYDFNATHRVRVTVLMCPSSSDPIEFLNTARILPKDEQRLRGTFKRMNRTITAKKIYDPEKDGIVYIVLADNVNDVYKTGIDATDGSQVVNFGNYGINYKIDLRTKKNNLTRICLSPLGGYYAGAMTANFEDGTSNVILTPEKRTYFGDKTPKEPDSVQKARERGHVLLTNYTELAELGAYSGKISFEYSPPGASNLPVNLILMKN